MRAWELEVMRKEKGVEGWDGLLRTRLFVLVLISLRREAPEKAPAIRFGGFTENAVYVKSCMCKVKTVLAWFVIVFA